MTPDHGVLDPERPLDPDLLVALVQVCEGLGYGNAHIERFAPVEVKAASDARARARP